MKEQELYVINRALDGHDIFGLPKQEELPLTELIIESIKNQLIIKGILETPDRFSDKGLLYAKRLEAYKNAASYIVIDNIILALMEKEKSTLLFYNKYYDEYTLETVALEQIIPMIQKKYVFMSESYAYDTAEEISCSSLDGYRFGEKDNFDIKIYEKKVLKSSKKYFLWDEKIHIFDYKNQMLKICNGNEALAQLKTEVFLYV